MKRDIHKFSEWLEKTVRAGIADERALRELKVAQKGSLKPTDRVQGDHAKAS
jgi:hypothetical protein